MGPVLQMVSVPMSLGFLASQTKELILNHISYPVK